MLEEEIDQIDPNAYMQLMYEQNSELADLVRVPHDRAPVVGAEVSAVQDFDPHENKVRRVDTLDRRP